MSTTTRRRFLQTAALGATVPLIPSSAEAGDPPASADAALTSIVRQRFKFLSEAQLKAVQAGIGRGLAAGAVLKRFSLEPVDEPATIFVSDVAE